MCLTRASRRRDDGLSVCTRVGRVTCRRGLLGRGAAVQVHRPQRRSRGAGGWALRRNRHRAVTLLVSPRDRARFDHEVRDGPADVRSVGRDLGARYVMEGSLRQAGSTCDVGATRGRGVGRPPLGGDLRSSVPRRRAIRPAGRPRAPDRLDRRRHERHPAARMSETLRGRADLDLLSPYEALLRAFGYYGESPSRSTPSCGTPSNAPSTGAGPSRLLVDVSSIYGNEHITVSTCGPTHSAGR